MNIDIPFNYINLLAFTVLLKYENRREIKLNDLKKYRDSLLERVIAEYENINHVFYLDEDKWEGDITFNYLDEEKEMKVFLEMYSDIFFLDGDILCLDKEVDYYQLYKKITEIKREENLSNRFESVSENVELLNILGVHQIQDLLNKYLKVEEEIENCYMQLYSDKEGVSSEKKLSFNLLMRGVMLYNLKNYKPYVVDAFRLIAHDMYDKCDDYNYDVYPIDLELYEDSEYCDEDNILCDMDVNLYDIYQYAIFGEHFLAIQNLSEILDRLYFFQMDEENITKEMDDLEIDDYDVMEDDYEFDEDDGYEFHDITEEYYVFYLNYIKKLNKYMEEYGENDDFINVKKRLLYALDKPGLGLYKDEKFEEELVKIEDNDLDEDSFDYIDDEIRFIADEVFLVNEDKNTIKKLLFISTYYDLTRDESIKAIVNTHADSDRFEFYSKIIFGQQKNKTKVKYDDKK